MLEERKRERGCVFVRGVEGCVCVVKEESRRYLSRLTEHVRYKETELEIYIDTHTQEGRTKVCGMCSVCMCLCV